MKAVVYTKYGPPDVLEQAEVEKPAPKDNEVLIKVHASSVSPMDFRFRQGTTIIARFMTGLLKPKPGMMILGVEFAGEVEAVGKNVKLFKPGDQVYGGGQPGAHAEYIYMPEEKVGAKPSSMTYEEAAGVPFCGTTAVYYLKYKADIQAGQKVLINGASGGVGTFAVQLAKYYGAEVTGVCSTANLEMVQSLGADRVIDYTKEDFTKNGQTYDIIFDAVGKRTYLQCKNSLSPGGYYLNTVATPPLLVQTVWTSRIGNKRVFFGLPPCTTKEFDILREIIEAGKMKTVIDRTYPLDEIAEAHAYAEKGHAKGKVVIKIVA